MRVVVLVIVWTGCGFHGPALGGGDDTGATTLVDDTAADFANPSEEVEVTTPARGVIEPQTYVWGALRVEGYPFADLQQSDTVTWDQLEAMLPGTGTGAALTGVLDADYGNGTPAGVGLVNGDNFTAVFRGELRLEAGTTTLELASDGPGIVELAIAGTFADHMFARTQSPALVPRLDIIAPAAGWYPIRAALTDTVGGANFHLREVVGGTPTTIAASRFRARTTDAPGLAVQAFDDSLLGAWVLDSLRDDAASFDFGAAPPGFAFPISGDYSLRFVGQWLVDAAGMYTLAPMVTGAAREWVDGKIVATQAWPGSSDGAQPVQLAAGWHDLAIDFAIVAGSARFSFAVAAGNDAAQPVAADHLRPVTRFGRLASARTVNTLGIPDGGKMVFALPALAPPPPQDAVVEAADISYGLTHDRPDQVTIELLHPDGTVDPVRVKTADMAALDYFGGRTAFAGKPATATGWLLRATDDTTGSGNGTYRDPTLAVAYRGGTGPIAPASVFASRPRPTPGAHQLVALRVVGDVPAGASVAVELRTCATEDACAAATWQPVSGPTFSIAGDELVEYRLTLASDGWALPSIDRVEIDYLP